MSHELDPDWMEFLRKYLDKAVHDVPGGQGVDLGITLKMVEGSPKQAQIAIQYLWREYDSNKKQGHSRHLALRLHCCSLMLAYVMKFGLEHSSTKMIFNFCPGFEAEFNKYLKEQQEQLNEH